jgi:hypothetical protein
MLDMKSKQATTKRNRPMLAVTIDPAILAWLKKAATQSRRTLSSMVESKLAEAYAARNTGDNTRGK